MKQGCAPGRNAFLAGWGAAQLPRSFEESQGTEGMENFWAWVIPILVLEVIGAQADEHMSPGYLPMYL